MAGHRAHSLAARRRPRPGSRPGAATAAPESGRLRPHRPVPKAARTCPPRTAEGRRRPTAGYLGRPRTADHHGRPRTAEHHGRPWTAECCGQPTAGCHGRPRTAECRGQPTAGCHGRPRTADHHGRPRTAECRGRPTAGWTDRTPTAERRSGPPEAVPTAARTGRPPPTAGMLRRKAVRCGLPPRMERNSPAPVPPRRCRRPTAAPHGHHPLGAPCHGHDPGPGRTGPD
jgi:hypothetical protein